MFGALLAYAYGKSKANRRAEEFYLQLEQDLIDYELTQHEEKQALIDIIDILLEERF